MVPGPAFADYTVSENTGKSMCRMDAICDLIRTSVRFGCYIHRPFLHVLHVMLQFRLRLRWHGVDKLWQSLFAIRATRCRPN